MMMRKMIQFGALSVVAVTLVGCGGAQHYASAVNSWQGAPRSALMHDWGHPSSVTQLSNGNELYTYRVVEHEPISKTYSPAPGFVRLSPQNINSVTLSHPPVITPHDESFWCETSFEINKRNVIVNTHYKGNNCVATKSGAHRWAFAH